MIETNILMRNIFMLKLHTQYRNLIDFVSYKYQCSLLFHTYSIGIRHKV